MSKMFSCRTSTAEADESPAFYSQYYSTNDSKKPTSKEIKRTACEI